jgi:hypothetical protein
VVVAAVNDGDVNVLAAQSFGGMNARKARANDDNARTGGGLRKLGRISQGMWVLSIQRCWKPAESHITSKGIAAFLILPL